MKVLIKPNDKDPLWKECVARFKAEIKEVPAPSQAYAPNYYYRTTRGLLEVTDYNWYLLDECLLVREKKES
jgi:hypothetical protein